MNDKLTIPDIAPMQSAPDIIRALGEYRAKCTEEGLSGEMARGKIDDAVVYVAQMASSLVWNVKPLEDR